MSCKRWLIVALFAGLFSPAISPAVAQDKDKSDLKFNTTYVPTDEKIIEKMFEMAKVGKDDVVFDLGCGDGRICAMAAKKWGCRGVGVDIEPERVLLWPDTIKKYDVKGYVYKGMLEYRLGDALKVPDLNKASVVMLYMFPEFMDQLKPLAQKALKPGSRIVAHDFRWRDTDWEPDQTVPYEGKTLYLWTVKAKKGGAKDVNFGLHFENLEIQLQKDGQKVTGGGVITLKDGKSITSAKSDHDKVTVSIEDSKKVTVTARDVDNKDAEFKITIRGKNEKDQDKETTLTVKIKKAN